MFLIVDSNILMSHPQILQDKENEIVLITDVLKELDGLKKNENAETAFKARRAAIIISRNIGKIILNTL
jgi:predicted ribonuclease YlaK